MNLSNEATFVINRIYDYGYRADVVGGAVRDFLLGDKPSDFDITTSATPEEIKEMYKN